MGWPQFWGVIWVTIGVTALALVVYFVFRKKDPKKPPTSNTQAVAEAVIDGFDKMASDMMGGRLQKMYPFFLTVIIMIAMGPIISLFGFENPATTLFYTMGLALISFIGIYVVGIVSQGLWSFLRHKYINPLELLSQFGPLISLSVRLFGSTFAFAVILQVVPILLQGMWLENLAVTWPIFASIFHWVLVAGDFALAMIQAYVFMTLTMMYWRQEIPDHEKKKSAKAAARAEARAKKEAMRDKQRLDELLQREYNEEMQKTFSNTWMIYINKINIFKR